MSEYTPKLALPLLVSGQAQKHLTHNEALNLIDTLCQLVVLSESAATPPVNPPATAAYIIPQNAAGAWSGLTGKLAVINGGAWYFIEPFEGMKAFNLETQKMRIYTQNSWQNFAAHIGEIDKLGINAVADTTNRLAVKSDAILLDHNGTSSQVKVNKAATGNTASHLFQTGYVGHAEFGLTGDDDFHIKVSPDGASWTEAMIIDKTSAIPRMPVGIKIGGTAAANHFDEYEEGSWTPALGAYAGTPASGVTYTSQLGRYTKIGNSVTLMAAIGWSAITTAGTGYLTIAGLPFATSNALHASGVNVPFAVGLPTNGFGYIDPSQTQFLIVKAGTINTTILNSEVSTSGLIFMGGTYQTN